MTPPGEHDGRREPVRGACVELEASAVKAGDVVDQRQAEAASAHGSIPPGTADEGLADTIRLVGRDAGSFVHHTDLRALRCLSHRDDDFATGVLERVVDEISDGEGEEIPIATHQRAVLCTNTHAIVALHAVGDIAQIDRFARVDLALR